MTRSALVIALALTMWTIYPVQAQPALSYRIIGTGQTKCYDNHGSIPPPKPGQAFYGQDAQHPGPQPAYRDNGDGTVTDLYTGLIWVQARGKKITWDDALVGATKCHVGGHGDWRMPNIKELYSLINFNGGFHSSIANSKPYLDTKYFGFAYGGAAPDERPIDCQDWTATQYVSTTMRGNPTVFGVNFADGRIKGYPKIHPGPPGMDKAAHKLFVRYVRGNPDYGRNKFKDNNNGTITDAATGLMWSKTDSGKGLNWEAALDSVQKCNTEKYLGHNDWRLPNAKELQGIVDYTQAPAINDAPACDPIFQVTRFDDGDYPYFWTSTTHLDGPLDRQGGAAIYIAFGRALGWMELPPNSGNRQLLDVHGAGAQRSDPKTGDPNLFPYGRGPQGDVIRIFNYVRCVRGP